MKQAEQHNAIPTYHDLQHVMDKVVGKLGLASTIQLLHNVIGDPSQNIEQADKIRLIASFIISRCITVFDLQEDQFYACQQSDYREARMACYHLLKKYTGASYARIAASFNQSKRNILYACQKCSEQLSIPNYFRDFISRYESLENGTIEFMKKINS